MRLIFAGTPEFALVALQQLHAAGHTIALVLTQPDRPAGRGLKLQASGVKQFALDKGLALAQPRSLRLDGKYPEDALAARGAIEAAQADAMVVAAYGLILPQWVLEMMGAAHEVASVGARKYGCFNIHASLLPRWRGAAPIHRAIEAGDSETGVTIMQMDVGLDTGDMLMAHPMPIAATDTTGTLQDRLAILGGRLILMTLEKALADDLRPVPQTPDGVTYANKIEKHESPIDWAQPAQRIAQKIRAFNPFPGASTTLGGEGLKVWMATALPGAPALGAQPGEILLVDAQGLVVAAQNSMVMLTELQRPGARRMTMAELLRGFALQPGMIFGKHKP